MTEQQRPLYVIARDIRNHWPNIAPSAKPYLEAMNTMTSLQDKYYNDSALDIVLRFLVNAGVWRGPDARRIKLELRSMIKATGYKL